jgi:hypothetical protein
MANTYTLISSFTVSTPAFSVTMSSIPATYTDLLIVASMRSDNSSSSEGQFLINGLTSGYYSKLLAGDGTTPNFYSNSSLSAATWGLTLNGSGTTSNTFANHQINILNYSSTTATKNWTIDGVTENNGAAQALTWLVQGGNSTTAAISSITFQAWQSFISFVAGTTFYIYGIKNS